MNSACHTLLDRSVIKVSGQDSTKFLQGLITNDINMLAADRWLYTYMLSPQGRILYDFFLILADDAILIDLPKEYKDEILKKLSMYKLRSDVHITDISSERMVFISKNPIDTISFKDPRSDDLFFRTISSYPNASEPGLLDEYHKIRIQNKIPEHTNDLIYNRSLPEEMRALEVNAVSFNKGCYVGQEVTARLHNLSKLRKFIFVVKALSDVFPSKGSELFIAEKKVGIMLGSHKDLGLALINTDEIKESDICNFDLKSENSIVKVCDDYSK